MILSDQIVAEGAMGAASMFGAAFGLQPSANNILDPNMTTSLPPEISETIGINQSMAVTMPDPQTFALGPGITLPTAPLAMVAPVGLTTCSEGTRIVPAGISPGNFFY